MKSFMMFVAMLMLWSMTACTAYENDPMTQVENINSLTSTYGARSLATSDALFQKLHLDELPGISPKEAYAILSSIKAHNQSEKHYAVTENPHGDHSDVNITMDETIGHKYTFTIQLHMQKDYEKGITYYKNYDATCSASTFQWYIKGFSFATDNVTGDNKFEGPSYFYFKILEDGCKYIQVPVTIKGTYCPTNNKAEFTYAL